MESGTTPTTNNPQNVEDYRSNNTYFLRMTLQGEYRH